MTDLSLQIIEHKGELIVDSCLIAARLGIEHDVFMRFVVKHFGYSKMSLNALDLLGVRARCFTYSDYDLGFTLDRIIDSFIQCDRFSDESRANLTWIFATIKYEAMANWRSTKLELGGVHPWFRQNHAFVIPNSQLVKVVARDRKRPDFLVKIDNNIYPVECKMEFNNQSLKQLRNYMRLWNSAKGFAVAYTLECVLSSNIVFIETPSI